jgi:ABC-2 type transport system ATP-binding protein
VSDGVAPVAEVAEVKAALPSIVVDAVTKSFGDVVAVSEVSFNVGPGVTALLGPNGAGKSTLLRLLVGVTRPTRGTVRVLGENPNDNPQLYRRIGLVPQQESLFESMSGMGFVALAASLQGLPNPNRSASAALRIVELDPDDTRPVRTYSKGMRQRVKVAQAIVHDPEVVILDEPLEGLDPRQRNHLITLFRRLGDEGRCVLVSSHVLDEVERFGSRVLVVSNGRLAAEGDFHAIRELMDDRPHRVRVRTDLPHEVAGALLASRAVVAARVEGADNLVVDTLDAPALRRDVAPAAQRVGAHLYEVVPLDDDLESVFRYLVGR